MEDRPDWLRPTPTLQRVIALGRDLALEGGVRTTITSVEIWEDWVVINYVQVPPPDRSSGAGPGEWFVTDDVGTKYGFHRASASGDEHMLRGHESIQPAPPPAASVLTIRFGEDGTPLQVELD